MIVIKPRNKLPREAVGSLSLEIFQSLLEAILGISIQLAILEAYCLIVDVQKFLPNCFTL